MNNQSTAEKQNGVNKGPARGPMGGPLGGGPMGQMVPGAKAKDFKSAITKLVEYIGKHIWKS